MVEHRSSFSSSCRSFRSRAIFSMLALCLRTERSVALYATYSKTSQKNTGSTISSVLINLTNFRPKGDARRKSIIDAQTTRCSHQSAFAHTRLQYLAIRHSEHCQHFLVFSHHQHMLEFNVFFRK